MAINTLFFYKENYKKRSKMKIHDIIVTPLKIISDDRGKVMHMLRKDDKIFSKFGEIYFSTILQNKIKAWHLHKESTLNYSCIKGKVKLVLFDNRKNSPSKGALEEIILSPTASLQIPRELSPVWIAVCPFESIINTCLYSKC